MKTNQNDSSLKKLHILPMKLVNGLHLTIGKFFKRKELPANLTH